MRVSDFFLVFFWFFFAPVRKIAAGGRCVILIRRDVQSAGKKGRKCRHWRAHIDVMLTRRSIDRMRKGRER